jgi:diguanylate cyclase (GGDEF)-like protein
LVLHAADTIEASADAILDRWARHVRAANVGRGRRPAPTHRAKENVRPLLAAVGAVVADRAALAEFRNGRPAYLEAKHFGELRQQQGEKIAELLEELRQLRREVVAAVVDRAAAVDASLVEAIRRVDDAVDQAAAIAIETYHTVEVEVLTELISLDPLTGLHDYGYFWDRLEQELVRSRRHGCPLSIVMLDIDAFKRYNDQYGHLWGDVALKEAASILQAISRRSDVVARYGGDEFVLILPETTLEGAATIGERTRTEFSSHRFRGKTTNAVTLTVSGGCSCTPDGAISSRTLVAQADGALYEAKRRGKNRIVPFAEGMPCLVP